MELQVARDEELGTKEKKRRKYDHLTVLKILKIKLETASHEN